MTTPQKLVDYAWDAVNLEGAMKITETMTLIKSIEEILGVSNLLSEKELLSLKKATQNNPNVNIYKLRALEFILAIVPYNNFETFLYERFNIKLQDVFLSLTSDKFNNNTRNLSKNDYSFSENRFTSINGGRNEDINEKDAKIRILQQEIILLKASNETNLSKISDLEMEVRSLNRYNLHLEQKHNNLDLLKQIHEKDNIIERLESQCKNYKFGAQSNSKLGLQPLIHELISNIDKQEALIERLRMQLQDGKLETKGVQDFVKKLPFIKQYYNFYKYKQDHKNFGILVLDLVTLILSTIAVINVLRFTLYLVKSSSNSSTYIYPFDDSDEVSISWWKEIEWLEYFIYRLNDK